MRLAEDATSRTGVVTAAEQRLGTLETEQGAARAELAHRHDDLAGELGAAKAERESAAAQLDRTLRLRYDRLRGSRKTEILVPANNGTCTACNTAIPRSRIGKLQAEGILIDGCEMCGAIIYLAEARA
jgi:predicted  nucleic acid-binding Zn-ribbon protein